MYPRNTVTVTVDVKVQKAMDAEFVSTGKRKQDVTVCDSSGFNKVTLWEENIDTLKEGACYTLENFVVKDYNCKKYLGMAMEGSKAIPIGDIGEQKKRV